jgi:hypothetical protein
MLNLTFIGQDVHAAQVKNLPGGVILAEFMTFVHEQL